MEHPHTILQKLLTMQMCAPLCKSVHQIFSEQETQLSLTWAASIAPRFSGFGKAAIFVGEVQDVPLSQSQELGSPVDIYHLLSMVFHMCGIHCNDEQEKKKKKVLIPEQC